MKPRFLFLMLMVLMTVLVFARGRTVIANGDAKPNPPIPSEVAKDLIVSGAQEDEGNVENPPMSSEVAKDLLLPGVADHSENVANPPIPQDVANALRGSVKILPRTSAVPSAP